MAQFRIHKAYYAPDLDVVTIAVEAIDGPFKGQVHDLYTTQTDLSQRTLETRDLELPDENWGDAEIAAEASEQLAAMGAELVVPEPPGEEDA